MARFCSLFSGSSGNCTYLGTADAGVLVDAGVAAKRIIAALQNRNIDPATLKAVFVTHEHSDHIKGLAVLAKNLDIPIIGSAKTLTAVINGGELSPGAKLLELDKKDADICGITAHRFATRHDCEGSSGYTFIMPSGIKMAVCTDLGVVTDEVRNSISGSSVMLIESNHDLTMLKKGPYPPYLKARIMSDDGHLSNPACAAELPDFFEQGATRIILGHISRQNNLPQLALGAARDSLLSLGARDGEDYILKAAAPDGTEVITV